MALWKKKLDVDKTDEIAAKAASFFKKSVGAITKSSTTTSNDISFAYVFGVIGLLADRNDKVGSESIVKITMIFLVKYLGIEQKASHEQMLQMITFTESEAGRHIMGIGAEAYLRYEKGDATAVLGLEELISGDYFKSTSQTEDDEYRAAVTSIKEKWIVFDRTIHLKPEFRLAQKIEMFANPVQSLIEANYPSVHRSPGTVWLAIFAAVAESGTYSLEKVSEAISELTRKYGPTKK